MKVAASPRSMAQVVAVLAFVISSATFLAAQDDEKGRCSKVVCKSPVTSHSALLIPHPYVQISYSYNKKAMRNNDHLIFAFHLPREP